MLNEQSAIFYIFTQGWRQGANFSDKKSNQRGQGYAPFLISLYKGRKHHVIFRKNNHSNWIETVYFYISYKEKSLLSFLAKSVEETLIVCTVYKCAVIEENSPMNC